MTNEQLIVKFNPANAANLKPEDLLEMRALTTEQISALADAYPNQPSRKSYLRLYDTKLEASRQLFQLSTWQNLRNVRKFSNKTNLVAYDFYQVGARAAAKQPKPAVNAPKKVVIDMTAQEAADELRRNIKATGLPKDKQKELIKAVNIVDNKLKWAGKKETVVQDFTADRPKSNFAINTPEDQDFPNV